MTLFRRCVEFSLHLLFCFWLRIYILKYHLRKDGNMERLKQTLGVLLFVTLMAVAAYMMLASSTVRSAEPITIGVPVERAWMGCTSEVVAIHVGEIQAKEGLEKAVRYFQDNRLICGTFPRAEWLPHEVVWSHKFATFTLKVVKMSLVGFIEVKIWVLTEADIIGWKEK